MFNLIFRTLILIAGSALGSAASLAADLAAQISDQDGVKVSVTPRSFEGPVWEFEVVFDTHVQEIKDDLSKDAVLVVEDGSSVVSLAWLGDPPGGHHRKGVLRFKAIEPRPAFLELRISRSGEPAPRSFKWKTK